MKPLQLLKILVQLKSKGLTLGALMMLVPPLDAAFFDGEVGMAIVTGLIRICALVPFLPPLDAVGATKFLVFVLGGLVAWVRIKTVAPLSQK